MNKVMQIYLTLAHSEGHEQSHANFDCEYLTMLTDWTIIAIANT